MSLFCGLLGVPSQHDNKKPRLTYVKTQQPPLRNSPIRCGRQHHEALERASPMQTYVRPAQMDGSCNGTYKFLPVSHPPDHYNTHSYHCQPRCVKRWEQIDLHRPRYYLGPSDLCRQCLPLPLGESQFNSPSQNTPLLHEILHDVLNENGYGYIGSQSKARGHSLDTTLPFTSRHQQHLRDGEIPLTQSRSHGRAGNSRFGEQLYSDQTRRRRRSYERTREPLSHRHW